MLEFPKWKVWLVSIVVAIGILLSIPSLIAGTPLAGSWPKWLPQYRISLGLDLAGGSHLLLEADARDALKQRLQAMEDLVRPSFVATHASRSVTSRPPVDGFPSSCVTPRRSMQPSSGCGT